MNEEKKSDLKNKKNSDLLKWIIITLTALAIIILIFWAGVFVGGMKARFSYRWAENYHKNFAGPKGGFFSNWRNAPPLPGDFIEAHGVFGEIIEVKENEFVIKGRGDVEKVVLITDKTIIQKRRKEVKKEDLRIGDWMVIIGSPNDEGQIEAKLIRLFEKNSNTSSMPLGFRRNQIF